MFWEWIHLVDPRWISVLASIYISKQRRLQTWASGVLVCTCIFAHHWCRDPWLTATCLVMSLPPSLPFHFAISMYTLLLQLNYWQWLLNSLSSPSHFFRLPDCSESGTVWSSCDTGLPGPSQNWAGCGEDQTKACQWLSNAPLSLVARLLSSLPPHS